MEQNQNTDQNVGGEQTPQMSSTIQEPQTPLAPQEPQAMQSTQSVLGHNETVAQSEQVKYAGFWIRWVASVMDGFILAIPMSIIYAIVTYMMGKSWGTTITLLLSWTYFIWMTKKYQATLGKKMVGIKVVSDKPGELAVGQLIIMETVGKFISSLILNIGYIMAAFTKRKQALHDMIAKTAVVYKNPSEKLSGWGKFAIVVAAILPVLAIVGILISIVLVGLSSAKYKAQDAMVKSSLLSVAAEVISYKDKNASYKGFVLSNNYSTSCSSQPVVNISEDGGQIAVFMKSCDGKGKYFCSNPENRLITETANADESYIRSGATVCDFTGIAE